MENTLKEKVLKSIEVLKDKQARIYFLTQDTKGNAKASVRFIYQVAKTLKDAVLSGLFLGFAMYGVYDLTNLATLKGWNLEMTLIDMAWGTFLCGSAAAVGFYVKNKTKE